MRILSVGNLYPPYHLGGYELLWQAAVRALREAGHEVSVLTTEERLGRPPGQPEDADVHRELRWYWRDHEFPRLSPGARLGLERHNHRVLRRHLARLRPDAVSWWAMGGMSLSLLERVRREEIPAVGWVIDEWFGYGPLVDQWTRMTGRAGLPRRLRGPAGGALGVPVGVDVGRAARWVFCSEDTRRAAARAHPDMPDALVVHPGVAADFRPEPPGPWSGRVLYAGRLDERKGVRTLIDAVLGAPELTLHIVGDGEPRVAQRLRARAAAAGDRVAFAAGVGRDRLARIYAEADVVAFPVEWAEPWGLVPLEAMAVGRPVVATGRGGSGEYLEHERNALTFEAGDAAALREALRRLAGDEALRARIVTGGFATAAEHSEAAWTRAVLGEHEALGQRRSST